MSEGMIINLQFLRSSNSTEITSEEIDDIRHVLSTEKVDQMKEYYYKKFFLLHGGKIRIAVYPAPYGNLVQIVDDMVGFVDQRPQKMIQNIIDKKDNKISDYRKNAGEDIRLLLVAEPRLNSGKMILPEENPSKIDCKGFNKVYFLSSPNKLWQLSPLSTGLSSVIPYSSSWFQRGHKPRGFFAQCLRLSLFNARSTA